MLLCLLFVGGTVAGLFTAETFNQKLPDTLDDAKRFGADQKFWSMPLRQKRKSPVLPNEKPAAEAEELNQIKYAP